MFEFIRELIIAIFLGCFWSVVAVGGWLLIKNYIGPYVINTMNKGINSKQKPLILIGLISFGISFFQEIAVIFFLVSIVGFFLYQD